MNKLCCQVSVLRCASLCFAVLEINLDQQQPRTTRRKAMMHSLLRLRYRNTASTVGFQAQRRLPGRALRLAGWLAGWLVRLLSIDMIRSQ